MDEEIGEVPYASEFQMATHGLFDEQGQTQWHDPESSRIYASIFYYEIINIFRLYINIFRLYSRI